MDSRTLKRQSRAELDVPWALGSQHLTEGRRPEEVVRQIQIPAVQQVEGFDAQLQLQPRRDRHLLQQCEIHVLTSGPFEDVAPRAAKITERLKSERRRVEPPSFRWITET